jgi:ribosome-associated protein
VQELRQCLRAARAERAAGKPPRQFRLLYQHLKTLLLPEAPAADPAQHPTDDHDDALLSD